MAGLDKGRVDAVHAAHYFLQPFSAIMRNYFLYFSINSSMPNAENYKIILISS